MWTIAAVAQLHNRDAVTNHSPGLPLRGYPGKAQIEVRNPVGVVAVVPISVPGVAAKRGNPGLCYVTASRYFAALCEEFGLDA